MTGIVVLTYVNAETQQMPQQHTLCILHRPSGVVAQESAEMSRTSLHVSTEDGTSEAGVSNSVLLVTISSVLVPTCFELRLHCRPCFVLVMESLGSADV